MTESQIIVTSPTELYSLIEKAVTLAVQKINVPAIVEPFQNEFLTIHEASSLLNLAKPTIYSLVNKRIIPFNKVGKKLYFSKIELNNWLKNGRKLTKSEIVGNLKNSKQLR